MTRSNAGSDGRRRRARDHNEVASQKPRANQISKLKPKISTGFGVIIARLVAENDTELSSLGS